MIAEDHLKACETAYAEEVDREKSFRAYAQTYIGFTAAYAGFLFFITEHAPPASWTEMLFYLLALSAFGLGLIAAIVVSQVSEYEFTFSPRDIVDELAINQSIQYFRQQRMADYTVAFERNSEVNDGKAKLLRYAAVLFAAGVAFHGAYFVDYSLENAKWPKNPVATKLPPNPSPTR